MQQIVDMDGIGPVLFRKNPRAKSLQITVKPHAEVRVTVPRHLSMLLAQRLVSSRSGWIAGQLQRLEALRLKLHARLPLRPALPQPAAKQLLAGRLQELASRHDLSYNRLFVRNQKTRWGSCSAQKNINLNIKLVRLPAELTDFVILHELVHTRVMHHGREFWELLTRLEPRARELARRMQVYHPAFL